MPRPPQELRRKAVDTDLKRIARLEAATQQTGRRTAPLGLALLFLAIVWAIAESQSGTADGRIFIVLAGVIGGYMALNIGANDVANNVGPAVGSRALSLTGALLIAAVFEAAGAVIAGAEVIATVSKGIIDSDALPDSTSFVWAMTAALLAAALWINIATMFGAPVSTTHSVVGGVVGAGIAVAGVGSVAWDTMATIAASWVISPVLGGVIAAAFLAFAKATVLDPADKVAAARRWVPILVAVMAGAFAAYLVTKGLKRVWQPGALAVALLGLAAAAAAWAYMRSSVSRRAAFLENRPKAVKTLFTGPLICAAALLSFAHGANDVANAIGPLAAIVGAVSDGAVADRVDVPFWVMLVGAGGISAGLVLFGPRLIRTVGHKITRLDSLRAFCIALSAAITVIVASALGLPVSSTHIAIGAVFGVGFLRESMANRRRRRESRFEETIEELDESGMLLSVASPERIAKRERKARKRKLVRRSHLLGIAAAWVITVPLSALLAAGLLTMLRAVLAS